MEVTDFDSRAAQSDLLGIFDIVFATFATFFSEFDLPIVALDFERFTSISCSFRFKYGGNSLKEGKTRLMLSFDSPDSVIEDDDSRLCRLIFSFFSHIFGEQQKEKLKRKSKSR